MNLLFTIISLLLVAIFSFGFGYITADNVNQRKWIDYYETQCIKSIELSQPQGGESDV